MTISGVSGNTMQTWQSAVQQRRQDLSQLASALQTGDLATAQKAFNDMQNLRSSGQGQTSGVNSSGNTVSNDFAALGQALQSGNLADAQNAFAKIQQDLQAQKGGHHHHHHHGGGAAGSSNTNSQNNAGTITPPDNSTISISA